jgi:GntR family transcriptional repressor for pyruvate dehydrogenase complex
MILGGAWTAWSATQSVGIRALFEIRKALEPNIAAWAALRANEDDIALLFDIVARVLPEGDRNPTRADPPLELAAWGDQAFHDQLARAAHNPVAVRLLQNLLDLLEDSRRRSLAIPGRARRSAEDHGRIARAVAAGDPDAAREAMTVHLAGVEESILRQAPGSSGWSRDGSP